MEQNFHSTQFTTQDQLLFDLDDGSLASSDWPGSVQGYCQFEPAGQSDPRLSTSPDYILSQQFTSNNNGYENFDHYMRANTTSFSYSPHDSFPQSFGEAHGTVTASAIWNGPQVPQTSSYHSDSSPMDIPPRNHQTQYGLLSPTVTNDTSFNSNGSWGTSFTSMSRTESMTGSIASYDTAVEGPMRFATQEIVRSELGTSPFDLIEYQADQRTHRLTPAIISSGKRPRGRRGPLNKAQRLSTAHMRHVKACPSCRARKAKCDPGIPCKQCINYFKSNLIYHPCRGQRLEDLAEKLLRGHIFPRKRTLGQDFGVNFKTFGDFNIYVSFGFGEPFVWPARVVSPFFLDNKFPNELVHEHVLYKWPTQHQGSSIQNVEKQLVFPAFLLNTASLKAAVDDHLTRLVNERNNFAQFPIFNSPLAILQDIYEFYSRLDGLTEEKARQLLGQALKVMELIHIGGDIRVSKNLDSRRIISQFFAPHITEQQVIPCYIRSQLGEVFTKLAMEYMREILSKLEIECLNKNCDQFAAIISTFIVIFMAIESIQHKTQREPFHSRHDEEMPPMSAAAFSDNVEGVVDLLDFYKNCFGGCHRERLLSVVGMDQHHLNTSTSASDRAGETLISRVRDSIHNLKPYLMERRKEPVAAGDATIFFDRLVARLLLLET